MISHEAGALHSDVVNRPTWLAIPEDVNALADKLWPGGVSREADGILALQGVSVGALAAEFGTPLYVMDENHFRGQAAQFRDAFQAAFAQIGSGADVYYASKAFSCHQTVQWVDEEGLNLDVASLAELLTAERAGFPAERIALHGNNKSPEEIDAAGAGRVGRVIIDCFEDIDRLQEAGRKHGCVVPVMVRVTVGVEAHTHSYIATSHDDQKFGLALADGVAAEAVGRVLAQPHLDLVGLHTHIGSQIFDSAGFEVAVRRLVGLHAQMCAEHKVSFRQINFGGGFGIRYTLQHQPKSPETIAQEMATYVADECGRVGCDVPRVAIEPGRAIAGPSGITLYSVGVVKPVTLEGGGRRVYVSVDGGMSDNIRAALYGADYSATLANRSSAAPPALCRVVGKHCESGDIVVMDEFLPADVAPGDLVAVPGTGAYCRSLASNYNMAPKPPVVAVRDGAARLIIRGEEPSDVIRLDVVS